MARREGAEDYQRLLRLGEGKADIAVVEDVDEVVGGERIDLDGPLIIALAEAEDDAGASGGDLRFGRHDGVEAERGRTPGPRGWPRGSGEDRGGSRRARSQRGRIVSSFRSSRSRITISYYQKWGTAAWNPAAALSLRDSRRSSTLCRPKTLLMSRLESHPGDRTVCAKCGRTAVTGSAFDVSKSDTGLEAVCPECLYRADLRKAADLLASWLLFGIVCGILAWMMPGRSAPWLGLNLAVVWIMMTATTLPHEVAHAITARWLRLGRGRICAGIGPLFFHGNLLGFPFLWRALPWGGHVEFHNPAGFTTLPRLFLVYAAGPGSHFLMAAAAWALAGAPDWSEFQPRRRLDFAWCFIAANFIQCCANIWPAWGTRYGSPYVSDGTALFQILFLRKRPFSPRQGLGPRWRRLFWPAVVAGAVMVVLAGVAFVDEMTFLNLYVLVCIFVALICWQFADSLQASRPKSPDDAALHPSGGSVHIQLAYLISAEIEREWLRIGEAARKALEACEGTGNEAELLAQLLELARAHPESFLPEYLTGFRHIRLKDWTAAQTAFEECLSAEIPPSVHSDALAGWMIAAASAGDLNPAALRKHLADFRAANPPPLALCCALDALGTYVLAAGCAELLSDADEWTEETMRLSPGEITISGTRGSVLIEGGSFAAGEILLREVVEHSPDDTDQGIACLYLAIAASRQGDAKKAAALAKRARALLPETSCFHKRLEEEFFSRRHSLH